MVQPGERQIAVVIHGIDEEERMDEDDVVALPLDRIGEVLEGRFGAQPDQAVQFDGESIRHRAIEAINGERRQIWKDAEPIGRLRGRFLLS